MSKIERNQPCPCGSGKKYKKCCLNKVSGTGGAKSNELDTLLSNGYKALEEQQTKKACDIWLELWDLLKKKVNKDIKNIDDAENIFSLQSALHNWCQDFEIELGNVGKENQEYHKKRIEFCSEFCSLFPESDSLVLFNMKRAIAISHFGMGKAGAGEKEFAALIKEYPRNVWGYIAWGDMYFIPEHKSIKRDFNNAENLYQIALKKEKKDINDKKIKMEKSVAEDRLEELHKERMKKA